MRSRRATFFIAFIALLASAPIAARLRVDDAAGSLEALSGEYADPVDPDTPLSFYPQDGKLMVESARLIPTPLEAISAMKFGVSGSGITLSFTLDSGGQAEDVIFSSAPDSPYKRIGPAVHHVFHDYHRTDIMIPMRDGVKLHAVVLDPADLKTPLPILLTRTPYGVDGTTCASFFAERPELARAGYIYVAEDIRGRFKSQGKFVMMRPLADHHDPKAIDESTDAFDTVAWLVKHLSGNNGRVGVLGTSYPGFLTIMAGIDPNPQVKAISPQAPMIDVWLGDDFFHNGAFRQSYGYDYVLGLESSKRTTQVSYGKTKDGNPVDGYDYFLKRGNFATDVKKSGTRVLPTWKLFLHNPAYDREWQSRAVEGHLDKVSVPTLTVGGYYDQEDMYGPQEEYAKLESHDAKHDSFLVLGPWRHGYWSSSSRNLGNLEYGQPVGKEFRADIEAKFFAYYLKGSSSAGDPAKFDLRDTASFQTGSNTWKYYSHFPPDDSRPTSLYLDADQRLSWSDSQNAAQTSYVSNPASPVPYRHRPIQPTYSQGSHWYNWLIEDQRFVTGRRDVAVWTLPVLKHDLTLTGDVTADIYAATTGSDADLVVKLIDKYPADSPDPKMRGYELMTNAEIFRGRYLSGFDDPQPLRPNAIYNYRFSLHGVDHVFDAGHTVMVEIQSTWFPLYDRNPQTFVPNIMTAPASAYEPETITIYSGPGHASNLKVPVVNQGTSAAADRLSR
ncbi:MAG TPA: CocE/NonD family hydrolase [Terracidiphilus sp.]